MTERALIWNITQIILMIIKGIWFCVENKTKKKQGSRLMCIKHKMFQP